MHTVKIYKYGILGLLTAALGISCTKSFDEKLNQQKNFNVSTIAQLHIPMVGATGNTLVVDAVPVSGAAMITGAVFPSSGYGFSLTPGIRAFLVSGTAPQVPITFAENMLPGKHHTIFIYDTITSPKQKTVIDNIVIPSDTTSRLRFANFVYSPYMIPNVDVFSWKANANLWANIPVTGVTDFVVYPSRITDTLYIRETGTMNQILKLTIIGGVTPKRNYTLSFRGSYSGTRTTSLFANY
ncbi:MAG: hypothetical protein ABIR30_05600 [Chitinophagaceae bacterium]